MVKMNIKTVSSAQMEDVTAKMAVKRLVRNILYVMVTITAQMAQMKDNAY